MSRDMQPHYPSGQDLERLAERAIVFLNRWTTLVPCFWGPSSEGKTHFVRAMAARLGARFLHVILKNMKPDDVLGAQVLTPSGELRVELSWWVKEAMAAVQEGRQVVVFLDELDKADDDLVAPILTFLRDRTVYGVALEDEEAIREGKKERRIYLVAACNPGAFDEAMRCRLAFIWWPTDPAGYYSVAGSSPLARAAVEKAAPLLAERRRRAEREPPPMPEFTKATVDALRRGEQELLRMARDERRFVLSLLMPPSLAEAVEEEMAHRQEHPPLDLLVEQPRELARLLARLELPEFVATAASALGHALKVGKREALPAITAAIYRGALAPVAAGGNGAGARREALERLAAWMAERPDKEPLGEMVADALSRLGGEAFFEELARDGLLHVREDGTLGGELVELLRALQEPVQEALIP
jgi:MoxR-like ATPase